MVSQKWYNVQAHKSNIFVSTIDLQPTLLYKSDISRLVSANCDISLSCVWCIVCLQKAMCGALLAYSGDGRDI